ncbi:phage major tail tube protein [Celerinatantimonas sp. MCCC 1A17872]|uniref:phage major tail tube protein n=1 Tax=Celerinatantimonas sp. MCCC 1A17872 TaxID=3177514 RepID=UPI0038C39F29
MAADHLLKSWAVWVDGVGKAGNCKDYTPPVLEVKTVDFTAGDMDMPIPVDDGMNPMETSVSIFGLDRTIMPLFGFQTGTNTSLSVRSVFTDASGSTFECVEAMRGLVTKIERDTQDNGSQRDKAMKVTMKLNYYKMSWAGADLIEIDPVNHVRSFGGVDILEGIRAAMMLT